MLTINWFRLICIIKCLIITVNIIQGAPIDIADTTAFSVTQNETHTPVLNNDGGSTTEYFPEKGAESPVEASTIKDVNANIAESISGETGVITTLPPVNDYVEETQQAITTMAAVRVKTDQTTNPPVFVDVASDNVNSQSATENSPRLGEDIPIEKVIVNEVTTTHSGIEINTDPQSENVSESIDSIKENENTQNIQNNATNNNDENPQNYVAQENDINLIPLLGEASEIVQSQLTNENTQNTLITELGDISEKSATSIVKDNENDHNQLTNENNQISGPQLSTVSSLLDEETTPAAPSVESPDQIIENSANFVSNTQNTNDNIVAAPNAVTQANIQEQEVKVGSSVSELPATNTANSATATENTQNSNIDEIPDEKTSFNTDYGTATGLYTSESVIDHTDTTNTAETIHNIEITATTQKSENLSNFEFSSTTPKIEEDSQVINGNVADIETSSRTQGNEDDSQVINGNIANIETSSTTQRSEDDPQVINGNLANIETSATTQRSEDDLQHVTGILPNIEISSINHTIVDSPQVDTENPQNIHVFSIAQNSEEYGESTAETKEQTQIEHLDTDTLNSQNSSENPNNIINTETAANNSENESTTDETILSVGDNQISVLETEVLDHQLISRQNHNSEIISLADNTATVSENIPEHGSIDFQLISEKTQLHQTLEENATDVNNNMEIITTSSTSTDFPSTTDSPQQTSENTVSEAGNQALVTSTESKDNLVENHDKTEDNENIINTTTKGFLKDNTSTTTTQENININSDTSLENPGFLTLRENIDVTMGNIQTTNFGSEESDKNDSEIITSTDRNDSSEVTQEQAKFTIDHLTSTEEANTEAINTTTYDNVPPSTEPAIATTTESIPKSSEEASTETIYTTTYKNVEASTETTTLTSEFSTPTPKLSEEPADISDGTKFLETTEENFAKNLQKAFANLLETDESEENIESTTFAANQEESTQEVETKTSATITESTPQEHPVTLNHQDRGTNMAATTNKQFASLLAETEMNVHKAFETLREWIASGKTMEMATKNPGQTEQAATEKPDNDKATTMETEQITTTQSDLEISTNVQTKEATEDVSEGHLKESVTTTATQEAQPTTYTPVVATMTPTHVDSFSYSEAKYAPYQVKDIGRTNNSLNEEETAMTTQDIKSTEFTEQTTQNDVYHTTMEPALNRVQLQKDLTGINLTYLEDSSEEATGNETHNKTQDQMQNNSEEALSEVIAKPTQESFYKEMVQFIEHDRTTPKVETQTQLPLTQASFLDEQQQQIESTTDSHSGAEHTTTVAANSPTNGEAFSTTTKEEQPTTIEITTNPIITTTETDITTTNIPETTTNEEEMTTTNEEETTTTTEKTEIDTTTLIEPVEAEGRSLALPPPKLEYLQSEDGVEVFYGYSIVKHN